MGGGRGDTFSKGLADRLAQPAAQFATAVSQLRGRLDRGCRFSTLLANLALGPAHSCATQMRLLLPGLPSTEHVCRERDPIGKLELYCDWALTAADANVSAATDEDVVAAQRLDELEHCIKSLYGLTLVAKLAWLREGREREQTRTPAAAADVAVISWPSAAGAEGSDAMLAESSCSRSSAIDPSADAVDGNFQTAPLSPGVDAPSEVVHAPHWRSMELAKCKLSPEDERGESECRRAAKAAASGELTVRARNNNCAGTLDGARAGGRSCAADKPSVHGAPADLREAAARVDRAPRQAALAPGVMNPSKPVDEVVARIRERLPQAWSQERVIPVLEALRSHRSDWLTAADLERAGISPKTVFSAAQQDPSLWKSSVRGAPGARKNYAKSAVISFVVEKWTPRPPRLSDT